MRTRVRRSHGPDNPGRPEAETHSTRLVRIGRAKGKTEEVLDLEPVNPKAGVCWMISPPEEGSLLVSCAVPNGDIYALDMDLP